MDPNLLRVFICVTNTKSISFAAKELGFTQANVTLRIKQLEKNIGYLLFHRTNRGVVLTKEGEKLYPYAIEIIKKVEEATLHIKNVNYQELLKIGSSQSNATVRLIPFIQMLKKDFVNMKLEFVVEGSIKLLEEVLNYKIDIAFIDGEAYNKEIEILNSFKEEVYFLEPKNQKAQNVTFAYRKNGIYSQYLNDYIKNKDDENYKTAYLENYEMILESVNLGYGVSLLPKKIIEKFGYIDKLKLIKANYPLYSHLICRKDTLPIIDEYLKKIKL